MTPSAVYRYVPIVAAVVGAGALAGPARGDDDDWRSRLRIGIVLGHRLGLHIERDRPRHHHHKHCRFIPGHYIERTEDVLVAPARYERRWIAPVYEYRHDRHGCVVQICIRPGRYETVHIAARYEHRVVRDWIPPRWECHKSCHSHGHH